VRLPILMGRARSLNIEDLLFISADTFQCGTTLNQPFVDRDTSLFKS